MPEKIPKPRALLVPPPLGVIRAERERRRAAEKWGSAAEAARKSLAEFTRQAWPIIEPATPLVWNWHLDLICTALERQIAGEEAYRQLMILVPPGTMKSILVSVTAPAWEWLDHPERRKAFFANDDDLATRDSRRMREIITTEWYQKLAHHCATQRKAVPWRLSRDQNEKVNFENTARGFRQCRSIGSTVTGKRADDQVIDDPHDAKAVIKGSTDQVRTRLQDTALALDMLATRVNRLSNARRTLIMQRVAEGDYAGRQLAAGGWFVVQLQMEFEPGNPLNHPDDPRKKAGELLCADLFPADELAKVKVKITPRHYSAQYQQKPLPSDGGPLKRWYWCFWYPADARPPPPIRMTVPVDTTVCGRHVPAGTLIECKQVALPAAAARQQTQSWDMAFKKTSDSAFVAGQVWAAVGASSYLLDQIRERLDFVQSVEAVRKMSATWPRALEKLVEDAANGPAILSTLQDEIPGMKAVNPKGGKEARANASAPTCSAGNVYIPHPALCPWVEAFIDECEAFPAGAFADQVDAATQYLLHRYHVGDDWALV